jgi:hypothetical protein
VYSGRSSETEVLAETCPSMRANCAWLFDKSLSEGQECRSILFLTKAPSSNFWVARVKAIIERDILAVYQDSRKRLRTRLIEDETSLAEIASALPKIDERYHRTTEIYRQRMIICTVLSYVPGAGLLSSLWMTATMPRLQPLLSSDKPPYAQLGEFAVNVLLWAIIGNVVSSGMVAALLAVRFAGILSDGYCTAVLASLAIACSVALFLSIRNLQAPQQRAAAQAS